MPVHVNIHMHKNCTLINMKTSTRMLRKHILHLIIVTRYLCHVSQHELQI